MTRMTFVRHVSLRLSSSSSSSSWWWWLPRLLSDQPTVVPKGGMRLARKKPSGKSAQIESQGFFVTPRALTAGRDVPVISNNNNSNNTKRVTHLSPDDKCYTNCTQINWRSSESFKLLDREIQFTELVNLLIDARVVSFATSNLELVQTTMLH